MHNLLYKLHTSRGLGGEPGQSERLCEVFTWCRSASDAAGRQDAEKGQEHIRLYTLLKVMDVQCMGFVGACIMALHTTWTGECNIYVGLCFKPSLAYSTTQLRGCFSFLLV